MEWVRSSAKARQTKSRARLERYTLSATELFGFDKATLRMPQPKLDEIAQAMRRDPQIDNVTITGYTDRIGTEAYNLKLSKQRAEAVKAYLVGKGIEPRRLEAPMTAMLRASKNGRSEAVTAPGSRSATRASYWSVAMKSKGLGPMSGAAIVSGGGGSGSRRSRRGRCAAVASPLPAYWRGIFARSITPVQRLNERRKFAAS